MGWTRCQGENLNNDYKSEEDLKSKLISGIIMSMLALCLDPTGIGGFAAWHKNVQNLEICQRNNKSEILPRIGSIIAIIAILRIIYLIFFGGILLLL